MSVGNRKPRYVSPPAFHLPAASPARIESTATASANPDLKPRATFGPATYYRQGIRTPGGPPKRPGRD